MRRSDRKREAQRLGERALVEPNSGKIPSWMQSTKPEQSVCIAKAISDYRAIRAVPASSPNLLDTIANEIGSKMLSEVDDAWAENWIPDDRRNGQHEHEDPRAAHGDVDGETPGSTQTDRKSSVSRSARQSPCSRAPVARPDVPC